jgi:hypothetical protein
VSNANYVVTYQNPGSQLQANPIVSAQIVVNAPSAGAAAFAAADPYWIEQLANPKTAIGAGVTVSGAGAARFSIVDITAALLAGTASAVGSALFVGGAATATLAVTLGAATTPGTYKIQTSPDGVTWTSQTTGAVVGVANATTTGATLTLPSGTNYVRATVSSAATGQTGTSVTLSAN